MVKENDGGVGFMRIIIWSLMILLLNACGNEQRRGVDGIMSDLSEAERERLPNQVDANYAQKRGDLLRELHANPAYKFVIISDFKGPSDDLYR